MVPPWASPGDGVKSLLMTGFRHQSAPAAMVNHY
jgi:hypothetical protein